MYKSTLTCSLLGGLSSLCCINAIQKPLELGFLPHYIPTYLQHHLHPPLQIFDRSKQLTSSDKSKLDAAVHDASVQLGQFCRENWPSLLACFIIVAVCPLSRRWLFMEHTAQGKGWVKVYRGTPKCRHPEIRTPCTF